jgi:4-aminobutyrate aminotransferase / (S)-3-amino-2-methylpropionate transaminase / 5-aminovalerate transaminase
MSAQASQNALLAHSDVIQQQDEETSNDLRQRAVAAQPRCLKTRTPSMAVIESSAGSYHFTADGRKLVDFTSGVLVANLGHNPTSWWQRIYKYLGHSSLGQATSDFINAAPLTTYNAVSPLEVQACERLLANMRAEPSGARMEQVLWAASGSEAVQKSLWASLAYRPGSDIILATRDGFHGKKGLSGAITGNESDKDRDQRVRFISFPKAECESVQRRREPLALAPYAAELAKLADEFGSRLCCLITEPYLGGGGSYHPQPEYMQMLQQFCREQGIPFILDEIQANFGRTGSMYAYTHYGVEPDIVLLGKGLGNGIPVDAAVGRADIFATLGYGEGSDTWSGHPLGCAAVLATLDEFETNAIVDRSQELASVLEEGLLRLTELPAVSAVRGEGTVWGVEFAAMPAGDSEAEGHTPDEVASAAVQACYRGDISGRAIHLLGPLAGRVVRVAPPLVLAIDEARDYLQAMYDILAGLPEYLKMKS